MKNYIAMLVTTTFFSGFFLGKVIGKTGAGGGLMGSLVTFCMQFIFIWFAFSVWSNVVLIILSLFFGLWYITQAEAYIVSRWGPQRRHTGEVVTEDLNVTNIDEVHGQAIAGLPVFLLPVTGYQEQIFLLILALIFFRLFDVRKPWPIRVVEKNLPGSAGIMFDDSVAGIFAASMACISWGSYTLW